MGIHQFYIPGLNLLKVLAELNSSVYPERLGRLFILNAPVFFSAAWAMIKVWLDKRIIEKIHVLSSDYKSVLLQHISHDNLPSFLGGSCTCSHMDGGCLPTRSTSLDKGNPQAFRYTTVLKKVNDAHVHELQIIQKTRLNFEFESQIPVTFVIKNDQRIW